MKSRMFFLIQLFLWLSITLTGVMTAAHAAMAPNQQVQAVQSLEDTLFAVHYDQEPLSDRVSRLEETVFGQAQTGPSLEARITKLQGSLSPKALGPLSPISKASTAPNAAKASNTASSTSQSASTANPLNRVPAGNQPRYSQIPAPGYGAPQTPQQVAYHNGPSSNGLNKSASVKPSAGTGTNATVARPEPGETDYPTVSQMELKEFGKTFAKEDITQRLNRLENQVFKMQQTGSLADRTDNLRMVVLGDTGTGQAQPAAANTAYGGYGGGYGQATVPAGGNPGYGNYPQAPNYGGYSTSGGGSAPYGGPPQSAYGTSGYNNGYNGGGNLGGLPNNIAAAGPNTGNINPMPGYGTPAGVGNTMPVSYQPQDNATGGVTPDMLAAMNEVEKEVLGNTYPSEPINARLNRVETKVFKATSPEMNPQDRIQRVIAVASAGGAPLNGKAKAKATFQVLLPIILTILPLVLL